jgi:hypothetical protein
LQNGVARESWTFAGKGLSRQSHRFAGCEGSFSGGARDLANGLTQRLALLERDDPSELISGIHQKLGEAQ